MMQLAVQVNGKVRDHVDLPVGTSEAEVKDAALKLPNVRKYIDGKTPLQVIYVRGRLVNVVVH
jgi:leucyl-tRNA synthetase